jgi:beta-glucosidase
MLLGRYPDGNDEAMPGPVAEDLAVISAPLDFYGINYYSPTTWGAPDTPNPRVGGQGDVPEDVPFVQVETGLPKTGLGGDIDPDGLREILVTLQQRYGDRLPPVIITENGTSQAPGTEEPDAGGRIRDTGRIAYLDAHVRAVHAAMEQGVDVRGYWHWSPTDNFEWAEGYTQRFGLVHVDYVTLKRTPKDSYAWFQRIVRG